jgi:hypothetical protein
MGEDPWSWREIFNFPSADYGGEGQATNTGAEIKPNNKQLVIQVPAWSLLIFEHV